LELDELVVEEVDELDEETELTMAANSEKTFGTSSACGLVPSVGFYGALGSIGRNIFILYFCCSRWRAKTHPV
jgi:hypothetical protein